MVAVVSARAENKTVFIIIYKENRESLEKNTTAYVTLTRLDNEEK